MNKTARIRAFIKALKALRGGTRGPSAASLAQRLSRVGKVKSSLKAGKPPLGARTKKWFQRQGESVVGTGKAKHLRKGEQSILGALGSLAKSPGKSMKKGWKNLSGFDKALLAAFTVPEVPHIVEGGPHQGKAIGRTLGDVVGWTALSRVPFAGQMLGWTALSELGERAGGAIQKGLS